MYRTFSDDTDACKSLHTQKTTQLFYQPEPNYWMVLVINVPKEIHVKNGEELNNYCGAEVSNRICKTILQQADNTFRLFRGTIEDNLKRQTAKASNDAAAGLLQLQKQLKVLFDKVFVQC